LPLSSFLDLLHKMDAYLRGATYLSVGQILYDKPVLEGTADTGAREAAGGGPLI
jgi:hypothetical protein